MTTRILLSGCLALTLAASAAGQNVIRFMPVDVDGKIVQMANRALMVSTASEQTYTVSVSNQTQVRVVGMAEPDVLVPGACVRFIGTVDKKQNRVQEKIDALTIFVPDQTSERMLGVVYPNASTPPPGEPPKQEKEMPKIVGGPGAFGAVLPPGKQPPQGMQLPADNAPPMADPNDGPRVGHKGVKGGGAENVEKFDIRGKIVTNKAGRLTIMLPSNQYLKPKLYAELAETPKIALDLADWSAVKKGDRVHVRGRQATPNMIEATEVYIELSEPLSYSTKKGKKLAAGKTPAEKPGKSGKKPAEPQEPEPKPPAEPPAEAAAAEKPADEAPRGDKADQILQVLQLAPADLQGKRGVKVALQGGQPEEFTPCKPEPVKNITDKFGEPDNIGGIQGNMPGDDGQMKPITWEIWTYGNIKFFVDENRTARYYNYTKK